MIDFQAKLIATVNPFVEPGGTVPAYVTDAKDPEIDHTTLNYVEQYVPNNSGLTI